MRKCELRRAGTSYIFAKAVSCIRIIGRFIQNRKVDGMGYIGENIFISTQRDITDEFGASAVVSWDAEKQYYDYYTRKCQANEVCGHYTQVRKLKDKYLPCSVIVRPIAT